MSYCRLSGFERDQINSFLIAGYGIRKISRSLGRSASTVSREVRRYGHRWFAYRPVQCNQIAVRNASYRRRGKLKILLNLALKEVVLEKLKLFWSPEQIESYLKTTYKDPKMQVSKETIYSYLYVFLRRNMREEFIKYMRQGRRVRRKKVSVNRSSKQSAVLGNIELIDERPTEVNDRLVPGHWEGDLMIGGAKAQTALGTLVERTTRFAILVPLKGKGAVEVREQFTKAICQMPSHLRRTLTYDQGSEMAQHRKFTEDTEMKVYFAHPRSPWERGTNENTNGLVRQFFPKGTNFNNISADEIKKVQDLLNQRPRKTLGWKTPAEKMSELLR